MDENPRGADPGTGAEQKPDATSEPTRKFGAARVRPRVEFGAPKPSEYQAQPTQPLTPDVLDDRPDGGYSRPSGDSPFGGGSTFGGGNDPFAPRSFAGGRVRVYGCSPGCLGASVVISLILTLLLNALL